MVVHAYDPSIWEAEAEERQGQDQSGLYCETLFQKTEWLVSLQTWGGDFNFLVFQDVAQRAMVLSPILEFLVLRFSSPCSLLGYDRAEGQ